MLSTARWKVMNFEAAIRGMRNPMESYDKGDSFVKYVLRDIPGLSLDGTEEKVAKITEEVFVLGKKDMELAKSLIRGDAPERKFLRQILVSVDITAPLYWWKEFDTYKVATVANSTSTMHKIASKEITIDNFSHDQLDRETVNSMFTMANIDTANCSYEDMLQIQIDALNKARWMYLETRDKKYWWQMIQLLPSSWLQTRTVSMNYETLYGIIRDRSNHKLDEWRTFVNDAATNCPYLNELVIQDILEKKEKRSKLITLEKTNEELNDIINNLKHKLDIYSYSYGDITDEMRTKYADTHQEIPQENNPIPDEIAEQLDLSDTVAIRTIY